MRKKLSLLFAAIGLVCFTSMGIRIPDNLKKVVAFIFVPNEAGTPVPNGTGFLVGVKNEKEPERFNVYLVTAKHVLQDATHKFFPTVWLRLNRRDGQAGLARLELTGSEKTVFTSSDPSVDIAVVPALPNEAVFDFLYLPDELLTTQEDFKKLGISEGSDVFFTGLFTAHIGQQKNYPIVRFGRVAMITDEPILWKEANRDPELLRLYLIETFSFGGNSGSPVFLFLGADREPGMLTLGPPVLRLAGIIKGSFDEGRPILAVERSRIDVSTQNMGIAAVIPSYLLHEILFSDELVQQRAKVEKPVK